MNQQQREAFERWYNAEYVRPIIPADRTEGGYQHPDAQAAWDAWQAALSHAEGEAVDLERYDAGVQAIMLSAAPTAPAGVTTDLVAALHYLLEQTVDRDLAHGLELTEGEMDARQQAIRAIERAGGVS